MSFVVYTCFGVKIHSKLLALFTWLNYDHDDALIALTKGCISIIFNPTLSIGPTLSN